MKVRVNTWLKISEKIGISGVILMLVSLLFAQSKHPAAFFGLAASWFFCAISFIMNGYSGAKHEKMFMKPGWYVTRKSRGYKMFNIDIIVQFGAASLFLYLTYWFFAKALG